MGLNGVYALDYTAIIAIANALEIKTDRTFLGKVRIFENAALENLKQQAGQAALLCNEAQKERCTIEHGEYLAWACENCKSKTFPS